MGGNDSLGGPGQELGRTTLASLSIIFNSRLLGQIGVKKVNGGKSKKYPNLIQIKHKITCLLH